MQSNEGALMSEVQSNFCPLLQIGELGGLTSMQPGAICLCVCLLTKLTGWVRTWQFLIKKEINKFILLFEIVFSF